MVEIKHVRFLCWAACDIKIWYRSKMLADFVGRHQPALTPASLYAERLLPQLTAFTVAHFYSRHLLRQTTFTPNRFYTRQQSAAPAVLNRKVAHATQNSSVTKTAARDTDTDKAPKRCWHAKSKGNKKFVSKLTFLL